MSPQATKASHLSAEQALGTGDNHIPGSHTPWLTLVMARLCLCGYYMCAGAGFIPCLPYVNGKNWGANLSEDAFPVTACLTHPLGAAFSAYLLL